MEFLEQCVWHRNHVYSSKLLSGSLYYHGGDRQQDKQICNLMSSLCKGYEETYSRANEERVTGNVNLNRHICQGISLFVTEQGDVQVQEH